jgi:translation initiation factor IF-2
MDKVRVNEIAKELGVKSKEVIEKSKELDIELKASSSTVSPETAQSIMQYILTGKLPEGFKTESKEEVVEQKIAPKEEIIEEQKEAVKTIEPKEEELVVASEESNSKDENEEESLAQSSIMRRRVGKIKIIKKRESETPKPKEKKEPAKNTNTKDESAMAKLFQSSNEKKTQQNESQAQKAEKKKKKKAPAIGHKSDVKKLDFDRDLRENESNNVVEEEDEVVLRDFYLEDAPEKKDEKKIDENKIKITRKSSFLNQQGIKRSKRRKAPKRVFKDEDVTSITIPDNCRVYEFAEKINKSVSEVITVLFKLGMMVNKNDFLESAYIEILADEFNVEVNTIDPLEEMDYAKAYDEYEDEYEEEIPPVVTIMGHVDHGKTSLLDKIRDANVTKGEAGGITQHIGAYMIEKNGKRVTFIDTPGHEAFTEMRARGASVTDIVIIVVAADDGVKPQTIEAINHAKAAEVPILIAVNKMDKATANLDRVKTQMAELGLTATDWGGDYEFIPVSAYNGDGISDLIDTILLQAEIMELRANPKRNAKAIVVESTLEKGRGASATVVVKNGTLNIGDNFVVNTTYGKIRAISNDLGKSIKSLKPGEPGTLIGFNEVPPAGSVLIVTDTEKEAREFAEKRAEYFRQKELSKSMKVTFDELGGLIAEGKIKSLPIILKADVQGSLEALKSSLEKLRNDEVKINIIHSAVGAISESDVTLASASENSIILGFNVRSSASIKAKAKDVGVELQTYTIIYNLIEDVRALLTGMMSPVIKEEITGQAEVRDTFSISKIGTIAGTIVIDGTITRNSKARLIRDGVIIYTSSINSLKRFKDDAKEVSKGYECGIMLDNYNDLRVGDIIETFKEVEEQASSL